MIIEPQEIELDGNTILCIDHNQTYWLCCYDDNNQIIRDTLEDDPISGGKTMFKGLGFAANHYGEFTAEKTRRNLTGSIVDTG